MSHGQPGKFECQLRLHMDALHVQQRQAPASCGEVIQSRCVAALHAHEGGNVQSKNRSCLPRVPQNLDIQNVQHMTCSRFIELPEEGAPSQSSTIFALNDHLRPMRKRKCLRNILICKRSAHQGSEEAWVEMDNVRGMYIWVRLSCKNCV